VALLDNIPGWKVFSAGIGLAALALVGYLAYVWFVAGPDDLKEKQQLAVNDALNQLAARYEEKVRLEGEQTIVVMPVGGQETSEGQIRHMIIERLNEIAGVKADVPKDPTLEERAIGVLKSVIDKETEGLDPTAVFEKSGEVNEVLSVTVAKLWSGPDNGVCVIDVSRIVRDESKTDRPAKILADERFTGRSGAGVAEDEGESGPGFWATLGGFLWRMIAVLAATAVLPLLSWPVAKAAFARDSNGLNAALLFVLTGLDVLVLFALVSFQFSTTAIVCAVLLAPVAIIWNLRMLNFIEER